MTVTQAFRDWSHAEQRVAQMLMEEFSHYDHLYRLCENAFWMVVYGASLQRAYQTYMRERADEEGCSPVFAAIFYGGAS